MAVLVTGPPKNWSYWISGIKLWVIKIVSNKIETCVRTLDFAKNDSDTNTAKYNEYWPFFHLIISVSYVHNPLYCLLIFNSHRVRCFIINDGCHSPSYHGMSCSFKAFFWVTFPVLPKYFNWKHSASAGVNAEVYWIPSHCRPNLKLLSQIKYNLKFIVTQYNYQSIYYF